MYSARFSATPLMFCFLFWSARRLHFKYEYLCHWKSGKENNFVDLKVTYCSLLHIIYILYEMHAYCIFNLCVWCTIFLFNTQELNSEMKKKSVFYPFYHRTMWNTLRHGTLVINGAHYQLITSSSGAHSTIHSFNYIYWIIHNKHSILL